MADELTTQLKATFDGTEASQGLAKLGTDAEKVSRKVKDAGDGANTGLKRIKDGADAAAMGMTAAEKRMSASMQNIAASLAAGGDAAKRFEAQLTLRGMDVSKFQPMLQGLRELQAEQEKAVESSKKLSEQSRQMAASIGALAAGFVSGAFMSKFISETINAEQEQAQLAAVLKSTGEAAGWSQQKLNDMADAMSKSTTFSAGDINQAQTRMLSYSNVVGEQFPRAMQAAADMSARMGMSITQAAEQIGKALDVPSEGLTALTKQGFRFTEQQKLLVEQLEATGQAGKAQAIILEAVESSYGGAAEAARNTLGGSLKALQNQFNDLMTGDQGSANGLRQGIEDLTNTMASESTKAGFQTVLKGITAIINTALTGISVLGRLATAISDSAKATDHQNQSRSFDYNRQQYNLMQELLKADPGNKNYETQAANYYKAMRDAHNAMQGITAGMSGASIPVVEPEKVEASTKAINNQTVALGKSSEWIKAYGTQAEKLNLELGEWKKKLGDAFTPEMEQAIRASYAAKSQGAKDAAAAAKQEAQQYRDLMSAINAKIATARMEAEGGRKLTESQQLEIKLAEELKTGKLKLNSADEANYRARIAILAAQERSIAATKREVEAYREQVANQEAIAADLVAQSKAREAGRQALDAYYNEVNDGTRSLQLEASLIGKSNVERATAIGQYQALIKYEKELQRIRDNTGYDEGQREEARAEALATYTKDLANAANKAVLDEWNNTVNQVESIFVTGFADMMNNGKSGWDSFCKSLKTSFFTLVAKEIYAMFAKPFVVQLVGSFLGIAGGGAGGAAMQAASGAGGLMNIASNLSSIWGFLTGGLNAAGAAGKWLATSNLTGLGGEAVQQMLGEFGAGMMNTASWSAASTAAQAGGAQLAGVIAGSLMNGFAGYGLSKFISGGYSAGGWVNTVAGIASMIPGIGPIAGLIGGVFNRAFGRKLKDSGIEGEFGGETGFEGRQFEFYKGGWFRSDKTKYKPLEEKTRKGFADTFTGYKDSIEAMGESLGLGADLLDGFTYKVKISLKGLSEEDAAKKIQEEFDKLGNAMAGVILTSDEYAKEEETRLQTLTRLSTSLQTVNEWLKVTGDQLFTVGLAGADMASKLIDAFGGQDQFSSVTSSYYDKYFTDAQKIDNVMKQMSSAMKELGFDAVPASRQAMMDLINAQDLTTEEGRKTYAALMGVANILDTVYSSAEQFKALEKDLDIQLLRATGREDEAVQLEREKRLRELEAYGDDVSKSIVEKQKAVWAAQDKEAQKQASLAATGLTVDSMVDGFIQQINEGRGAQAGEWLADQIAVGFEQAIYGQAIGIIMNSIIDGVITPVVTAAMTGSTISAAVSGAAIETMVKNATAAAEALSLLLNDPAFKEAMAKVLGVVKDLGNSIGSTIPKMSTYRQATTNVANGYGSATDAANSAAEAAKKLADQWKSTIDSMGNEMKRLRGELLGETEDGGMAYFESLFAIKTAQARAGDQDAANELPSIIQALEGLAKGTAGTKAEVLLMQSAWLDSIKVTRDYLANKYGVDIGNEQSAVSGATTAAAVIKGGANTAVLGALQTSSDNPAVLAELKALRLEVELLRKDQRAISDVETPALQNIDRSTNRLKMLKEMEDM